MHRRGPIRGASGSPDCVLPQTIRDRQGRADAAVRQHSAQEPRGPVKPPLSMQSGGPAVIQTTLERCGCSSQPIGSLSAVDREELRRQLVAKLEIEKAHDEVRLVTLSGVVLGRLGRNPDSGYWELDWRMGWKRLSSQHAGSGEAEHAETWAVEEIANLMAVERSAIDAGGPWGRRSPPPGVS